MKRAFTVAELLIIIAVILILSAAAIGGSQGLMRSLRFGNSFNKIMFMIQRARSLAVTGKNPDVKSYQVNFKLPLEDGLPAPGAAAHTAALQKILEGATSAPDDDSTEISETFTLETSTRLFFAATPPAGITETCDSVTLTFKNGNAQTSLSCNTTAISQITLELKENGAERSKKILIHGATGIPQVL